ncbi:MAG: glycosyltransferase [Pyrinomonadaceae bacterium]|nr:glycosyltransferase [Sphingobacteriaceae bacterium]
MYSDYNLCIIKPNKSVYSETFIAQHINRLKGNVKVLYGGAFPVYDHNGKHLIKSKWLILSYLFQKRILKKKSIALRDKALVSYLKEEKINVVLAEYGYVGGMVSRACELAGVPLVVHFHGADAHHKATVAKYLAFYKKCFAYASAIVGVSNDMLAALQALGAPKEKLHYNPYGVDLGQFCPVDLSQSSPHFLSVGRFVEKKSPSSVILAFEKVFEKQPEARLYMVGDGPLFNESVQLVSANGLTDKVIFTGVLPAKKIKDIMEGKRAFVQHSVTPENGDKEGTPNTILEASAAGLPVVSTKHAGIKEAVIHNETGYLVEEFDIERMASYMLKLADNVDLAQQLGKNGTEHIQANYNMDDRINALNKIIQNSI